MAAALPHILIAGLVDCKFSEDGYNGDFSVANDTNGIVLVTPSTGAKSTTFTIVGLVIGSGKLVWSDSKGNKFNMKVKKWLALDHPLEPGQKKERGPSPGGPLSFPTGTEARGVSF